MLLDSVGQEFRHTEDGLSFLCDVGSFVGKLNSWALESPGSMCGAWTGMTQGLGSAGTVNQSSHLWFLHVA